ncbi:MAG: hypothetical protein M1820_009652 [Bogoriella megaspora]|nr:MAG: hypothetical protein M1820_009652 [Bogoriella megaspora]
MFFISYAKNFFVPPANYGIGSATPVRTLENALGAGDSSRNTVAFVNNGHTGGQIDNVINQIAGTVRNSGKNVQIVDADVDLLRVCRSSLRGASDCFAAASFVSSPTEGAGGIWNYTIRADGALGAKIFVDKTNNDAEIYILPFQHAIDTAIASNNGTGLPAAVNEYPYTSENSQQRADNIERLYMGTLINILAVAFFLSIVGVTYQLTGQMASERELGMSQLIEAMSPDTVRWHTQAARLLSYHIAFDIIYFPGWILMAAIVNRLVFPATSFGLVFIVHLLAGLALSSWSILGGSLFRKAQLSGITVTLVSIILAIIAQVVTPQTSGAIALLSLLFPSMNYTFIIIYMARWERHLFASDFARGAPESPWQLPGYVFLILFLIQIIAFPILGAYTERALYGTASKARLVSRDDQNVSNTIELSSFSKYYSPGWWNRKVATRFGRPLKETVKAVDNFSLTALKGQVMVLLGANGSGKSTTLDCIAGLQKPTAGTIALDGHGGLGLCPQKNVLWDDLTVKEHCFIFAHLKSQQKVDVLGSLRRALRAPWSRYRGTKENATYSSVQTEALGLINACDLDLKINAKASTLSGGQKRKLQLAVMFTGGSQVCCVDEVSSGLDPLSRRKIWDILLAERGRRTILLTTHFLDEADVLSDHIAILSKGKLKAEGSAVELKHRFGGGYRVHFYNYGGKLDLPEGTEDIPRQVLYDQTIFNVGDSARAASFVSKLELAGFSEYQVSGPTIEDVFLKLSEEIQDNEIVHDATSVEDTGDVKAVQYDNNRLKSPSDEDAEYKGPRLVTGKGTGLSRQGWILFRKRLTILRRNYLPYCATILIPVIAAGLVTLFLKNFNALGCDPSAQSSNPDVSSLIMDFNFQPLIPVGPSDRIPPIQELAQLSQLNASNFHVVESVSDFNTFIAQNYGNVTPGGLFLGSGPNDASLFAFVANFDISFSVLTQNLLDNLLSQTFIATQYQTFAVPFAPSAGKTLQLILYFGLAMSAYPGFFALYPTVERLRKIRALHYSNGVQAAPLWSAYMIFDFLFVLLVSVLVTAIFVGVSEVWYAPGYLFVVFFLYGLTSILLSYVISLFTTSQLASFAFAAGGQAIFFLIYFIIPAGRIDHDVLLANFTFGLVTPAGNMLRALLLTLNEFSFVCHGDALASYPGDITVYGGPILYLLGQAIVLFTTLVWWDSGYKPGFLTRTKHRTEDLEETDTHEPEVLDELTRVKSSNDGLRVIHVSKTFGRNTAVQDVTFGVKRGEVFALLGPNGAGKSTTISLVRGDVRPSGHKGDIFVENISIIKHRAAARNHLGVCPQFDAIDQMTVVEHLRFYAMARGVADVANNVSEIITAVGLEPFKHRMAGKLSGGNKRKLSLGIALMGNPSVLLLDEPSSGMDAASKRVMWQTLSAITAGRALVITTHSMEEADALADRAGIMARKMLALGTSDFLRKKYGDAYHVHLVHRSAPHTSDEEMQRVRTWVKENIPNAVTEDRMFHGQLRFMVSNASVKDIETKLKGDRERILDIDAKPKAFVDEDKISSLSRPGSSMASSSPVERPQAGVAALFALLEAHKEELGFEYYSVSQTTLDQVFLNIVGRHNIEEENQQREGVDKKRKGKKGLFSR